MCLNKDDWDGLIHSFVEVLSVEDNCCRDDDMKELDLSGYTKLKELIVGDCCFKSVERLQIIGLNDLESVVIGCGSFVKKGYDTKNGRDDNRHFCLKNCPKLRELMIGWKSFLDYCVCEIENVDSLEVIEMGDLNQKSVNFLYASALELKSILIHSE